MVEGQAVVPEEHVLRELRHKPLLVEGSRNDDSVNLAIVAWYKHGPFPGWRNLYDSVIETADEYLLDMGDADLDYLEDKCRTLIEYLPKWEANGDVLDFAII